MLIEQIIEFELRGPVPPGRTYTPIIDYFHKTKIAKDSLSVVARANVVRGHYYKLNFCI